jgi:hypothetical protein
MSHNPMGLHGVVLSEVQRQTYFRCGSLNLQRRAGLGSDVSPKVFHGFPKFLSGMTVQLVVFKCRGCTSNDSTPSTYFTIRHYIYIYICIYIC